MDRLRLLELVTPELKNAPAALWDSLARLDTYRLKFPSAPPQLTNAVMLGHLLAPLGLLARPPRPPAGGRKPAPDRIGFGILPVPRRDIERLRHIMQSAPRLLEPELPPRLVRSLPNRPAFDDALLWLEISGESPDAVAHWRQAKTETAETGNPEPRRRRRRRRRRRPPSTTT
jgi:hypothetical protein